MAEPTIFEATFHEVGGSTTAHVRISLPIHKQAWVEKVKQNVGYWECLLRLEIKGKAKEKGAIGETSLQSIYTAGLYATAHLTRKSKDWTTSDGLPLCMVFPRQVQIAWRQEFYDRMCELMDDEDRKFQAEIERRNLGAHREQLRMADIKRTEPELCAFLKRLEYSDHQIAGMTLETRLLHDLNLKGDNFLDTMELLHREFGVDFGAFDWSRYTPSEGDLLFPSPLLAKLLGKYRRPEDFEPLTLGMIAAALREKCWRAREVSNSVPFEPQV